MCCRAAYCPKAGIQGGADAAWHAGALDHKATLLDAEGACAVAVSEGGGAKG